jgi:hypothetical protein
MLKKIVFVLLQPTLNGSVARYPRLEGISHYNNPPRVCVSTSLSVLSKIPLHRLSIVFCLHSRRQRGALMRSNHGLTNLRQRPAEHNAQILLLFHQVDSTTLMSMRFPTTT